MAIRTFAAIDVGSYELGMKIFEVSRTRGIREIDHVVRKIDLGSETYATGKLSLHRIQEVRDRGVSGVWHLGDPGDDECLHHPFSVGGGNRNPD